MASLIVLDASVLVAYLDSNDTHHVAAEALLVHVVDDELGANSLTLAEVLVVPLRDARLQPVRKALADLDIQELWFPHDAATRLAELRVGTGLRMPDCCVLLAAEVTAGGIASFDQRLIQAAEARSIPVVHHS